MSLPTGPPLLETDVCHLKKLVVLLNWVAGDVCAELRPMLHSPGVITVAHYMLRIWSCLVGTGVVRHKAVLLSYMISS